MPPPEPFLIFTRKRLANDVDIVLFAELRWRGPALCC